MDLYNNKYNSMCLEDSSDYAVDIIVKGNKIYKVKNYRWIIKNKKELDETIEELAIDRNFILQSAKPELITLVQPNSETYATISVIRGVINDDESTSTMWEIEYVKPELLGSTN